MTDKTDTDTDSKVVELVPKEELKIYHDGLNDAKTDELSVQLKNTTTRIDELSETLSQFKKYHNQTLERERKSHQKEIEKLQKEQREAVKDGNEVAYDSVTDEIKNLKESSPENPQIDKEISAAYESFVARNKWFDSNHEMRSVAQGISNALLSVNPEMSITENMKQVESRVKELYPGYFENKRRKNPTSVEDGDSMATTGIKKGKMTFSDLPLEAQIAGKRFVKEKLFDTMEEYVKDFQKGIK